MEHFYQDIGEDWFNYPELYQSVVAKFTEGNFIEIGSWKGRSAAYMAVEIFNSKKNINFYCVDTWKGSVEHEELDCVKDDSLYGQFLNNIQRVSDVIKPIRKSSIEASKDFEDGFFDFIFIDAAHDYESVKQDLLAWYPKLKKGGIFAGHDYHPVWGVYNAVNEWSSQFNKPILEQGACWVHYN